MIETTKSYVIQIKKCKDTMWMNAIIHPYLFETEEEVFAKFNEIEKFPEYEYRVAKQTVIIEVLG